MQLQVATVPQAIQVLADQVVLQTDKADIHAEISSEEVENLPYNGTEGKNFQALLLMQPGANTTAGTGEANSAAATRSEPSRYLRTAFRPKPITPGWTARPTPIRGCR
jgi:hypothetical protein